jgi:hypothetical protein
MCLNHSALCPNTRACPGQMCGWNVLQEWRLDPNRRIMSKNGSQILNHLISRNDIRNGGKVFSVTQEDYPVPNQPIRKNTIRSTNLFDQVSQLVAGKTSTAARNLVTLGNSNLSSPTVQSEHQPMLTSPLVLAWKGHDLEARSSLEISVQKRQFEQCGRRRTMLIWSQAKQREVRYV